MRTTSAPGTPSPVNLVDHGKTLIHLDQGKISADGKLKVCRNTLLTLKNKLECVETVRAELVEA
jgi:hypothetical protein